MIISQLELILTPSPRKNLPSQVELFSIFYAKSVFSDFNKNVINDDNFGMRITRSQYIYTYTKHSFLIKKKVFSSEQ